VGYRETSRLRGMSKKLRIDDGFAKKFTCAIGIFENNALFMAILEFSLF